MDSEESSLPTATFEDRFVTYRVQRHLGDRRDILAGFQAAEGGMIPLGSFRWEDKHDDGDDDHPILEVGMIVTCSDCPLTHIA